MYDITSLDKLEVVNPLVAIDACREPSKCNTVVFPTYSPSVENPPYISSMFLFINFLKGFFLLYKYKKQKNDMDKIIL